MGYYDKYLEHHGILGQKWGVRRFESANGHLTAAGKARYDGDKVTAKEKHAFSAKAAGYKALATMHKINATAPNTKSGKALAKAAYKQANKAAEKAQKEADEKKAAKQSDPEAAARRKKMIIAGAAVVGTAIAAYGGYKLHQISTSKPKQQANNRLASEASSLARSVTAEGPKSFSSRSTQNSASTVRAMTSQKLANASRTTSSGRQTTQRVMSIAGQQKFSQASQANNDLVNDLLRRNASMLSGF